MDRLYLFADLVGSCTELGIPCNSGEGAISNALTLVFSVLGGLAIIFVIVGAMRYSLSAGDPAKAKQAKDTIVYALIGMAISLFAVAIVRFVTRNVL